MGVRQRAWKRARAVAGCFSQEDECPERPMFCVSQTFRCGWEPGWLCVLGEGCSAGKEPRCACGHAHSSVPAQCQRLNIDCRNPASVSHLPASRLPPVPLQTGRHEHLPESSTRSVTGQNPWSLAPGPGPAAPPGGRHQVQAPPKHTHTRFLARRQHPGKRD